MIRGAIYQVDLGAARGHEQRGRRYGLVVSPGDVDWTVVTVVPTSTSARATVFRPTLEVAGTPTRFLVDQIRTIDVNYVGELVDLLSRDELLEVEAAMASYLGLVPVPERR